MIRNAIIITCLVLSALLILDSLNAFQALLYFLIAGKLPGMNVYVEATTLLSLYGLITGFVAGRLAVRYRHYALSPQL